MLDRAMGVHDGSIVSNRTRFCSAAGVDYGDMVYQRIMYGPEQAYDQLVRVGTNDTTKHISEIAADAVYTTERGVGLFLPVADCVATVFYDPARRALAVAHLGRHSTYANLATKVVEYFKQHGSQPHDIIAWLSPHAQKQSYVLEWFDKANDAAWQGFYQQKSDGYHLDMAGYNMQLMQNSGMVAGNIYCSPVDTATSSGYFSHSQGDTSGRVALIAMVR